MVDNEASDTKYRWEWRDIVSELNQKRELIPKIEWKIFEDSIQNKLSQAVRNKTNLVSILE